MDKESRFPKYLLQRDKKERILYFKEKIIRHEILTEVFDEAIDAIYSEVDPPIIMIYGPAGVGKTTLCERIDTCLQERFTGNPGHIPGVLVEARSEGKRGFDWRDFYISCLQAMGEPFIDKKIDPVKFIRHLKSAKVKLHNQSTEHDLQVAVEAALIHREPQAVIVDEAHVIKYSASGRSLLTQMRTLKSMANKRRHVLVGTYELLDLADLCGQLNRRYKEIHLHRYRYDKPEELKAYYAALVNFERHMPLEIRPSFSSYFSYIYEKSCGCIGILKDWISQSLELAINRGDKTVTLEHLQATQIPDRRLLIIAREIRDGEERLNIEYSNDIKGYLNMNDSVQYKMNHSGNKKSKRLKPGTRKPKRDPVGEDVTGC